MGVAWWLGGFRNPQPGYHAKVHKRITPRRALRKKFTHPIMTTHILRARLHRKAKSVPSPMAIPAKDVELCEDDKITGPQVTAYASDITSGRVLAIDPEAPGLHLPTTAEGLMRAGGVGPFVAECYTLLRHDFPLLAMRRLQLVEKLAVDAGVTLREHPQDPRVAAIFATENELEPMLRIMRDDDGWERFSFKAHRNVQTFVRMMEGRAGTGTRGAVKVVGELPHTIEATCAPLLHPDIYSTWIPGVSKSVELPTRPSNFRMHIYTRIIRIPLPFLALRDCVIQGYGEVYSPNSIAVYLTDSEHLPDEGLPPGSEDHELLKRLSPPGENVRIGITGCFLIERLAERRTRLSACVLVDPKLSILPTVVIDWFVKHVAANLIPMWDKQSAKFEAGGKLEHLRSQGNQASVYAEMTRRLAALDAEPQTGVES